MRADRGLGDHRLDRRRRSARTAACPWRAALPRRPGWRATRARTSLARHLAASGPSGRRRARARPCRRRARRRSAACVPSALGAHEYSGAIVRTVLLWKSRVRVPVCEVVEIRPAMPRLADRRRAAGRRSRNCGSRSCWISRVTRVSPRAVAADDVRSPSRRAASSGTRRGCRRRQAGTSTRSGPLAHDRRRGAGIGGRDRS